MDEDIRAPKGGGFNPRNEFSLCFNLKFEEMNSDEDIALLTMVWRSPVLPQPGDTIHIGVMHYDFVIRIRGYRNTRKFSGVSWDEDKGVTLRATLFNLRSPREFLDRIEGLVTALPEYRERLTAILHIIPGAEMLTAEQTALH